MSVDVFFGYGSLVNRATHRYDAPRPGTVGGWRRVWRHTDLRPVAYLTVVPDDRSDIDGLIAEVPGGDWQALDQRERAYDRVMTQTRCAAEVAIYSIPDGKHGTPSDTHPVLLSYIDVVVQGFYDVYGEAGVARFFETTGGWDIPVLNDRVAPVYPRHQRLTGWERDMVDAYLAASPARVKDLE